MMRGIVNWSLRFRLFVVLLAAGATAAGVSQLRAAPVDVLPEFTPPYVEIQVEALGLSAAEVEEFITVPFEGDLLNGVAGISTIRSESVAGLSSITLVFEEGTDLLGARQLVQERLTGAQALPRVSKPPQMLQPLSSASRVMVVGLRSDEHSLIDLGLLARWTLRPRLLGIPGVANVAIWGQREQQLQVQVDPRRLRASDVTLQQVINTTGNAQIVSPLSFLEASTPGTGGFIDTPNQRLQIRHILPIANPAGLAKVPLENVRGRRLALGDVARIVDDHQPLIGEAIVGGGPGLLLVIEKFPGANTLDVTRGVESALADMRAGLGGVDVDSNVFRPANYIDAALDNLTLALLLASAYFALVVLAVMFHWRTALVAIVSAPVALIVAASVLDLLGQTMNMMLLLGLALGAVIAVDDAVVASERIRARWREARRAGGEATITSIVRAAIVEVRTPLAYATLIVVATALPAAVLQGRPGDFFAPLAFGYVAAVLSSLAVSLTVVPALAALLLRESRRPERRRPRFARFVEAPYELSLRRILAQPSAAKVVSIAAAAVVLVALATVPQLNARLIPSFKETELLVQLQAVPGTSRPEMVRIASRIGRALGAVDGVRNVGVHMGRAVTGDQITGMNTGTISVNIDRRADHGDTVAAIEAVLDGYPGLESSVATYADGVIDAVAAVDDGAAAVPGSDGVLDVLTGAGEPVTVRIYGKDLGELRARGEALRRELMSIDGIVDPRMDLPPREPTLEVEVDVAAAERYGIKPGDVRRAAAALVQGIEVGSLFEEQRVYEVVVVGEPNLRRSVSDIRNLLIDTPDGGQVRLSQVAKVEIVPEPTVIRREAASRHVDVVAGIDGRDLEDVLGDVRRTIDTMAFPLEYRAEVISASAERDAVRLRFVTFGIAAVVGIFLLLQAAVGSWRLAAVVSLTLLASLSGSVLAVLLSGGEFTLGSLAGCFAVFALAVRQAVLLIGRYHGIEAGDLDRARDDVAVAGAREQLPPVFAGSVALLAALLPFVALGSRAGLELVHPMAVAVIGGLVSTAALTLFVLPALYVRFAPAPDPERAEIAVPEATGAS
jgi:Cu/Ag efflux pump CusA